jgi:succinyl-CoA synthetase alpha subunit
MSLIGYHIAIRVTSAKHRRPTS